MDELVVNQVYERLNHDKPAYFSTTITGIWWAYFMQNILIVG